MAFILTAVKPCSRRGRAGLLDLVGAVAADPGIGADPVAHLAAEHLPGRNAERLALEVPQRLLEPGERRHQHRAAAVEAAAIGDLPDVLDPARVMADEAVAQRLERAVDRLGIALEAGLAPADRAVVAFDPHEQPARRDEEGFDAVDLHDVHRRRPDWPAAATLPLAHRSGIRRSGRGALSASGTVRHTLDAGKHLAPVADQLLVGLADVADVAVEIVQAERVDVAVLLAQRGVPVDLVGQRIPGEADGRDADVAQAQDVGPFLPQPLHRFLARSGLRGSWFRCASPARGSGCNIGG